MSRVMTRAAQLLTSFKRTPAMMARFVVISPFLLGRFGGPSSTLKAEITAPSKTPAPAEMPAIVTEPAFGSSIDPALVRGVAPSNGRAPCNHKGSTRDWYKTLNPAAPVNVDLFNDTNGFGRDKKSEVMAQLNDHKARGVTPIATRAARGAPIA